MKRLWLLAASSMVVSISLAAQTPAPPSPQSARQALIEMFLGKGADDFAKHLPDAARRVLIHKGETPETSIALRIATIGREMTAQGERLETFDTGPNIVVSEDADHHERIEVTVEHDTLIGEENEIELSVHVYKDGQPQSMPVIPRLIFTLVQDKNIWRLIELTVAAHVPLTDPDYLLGLRREQDESNQGTAQARIMMIAGAETRYAASHGETGYTCSLANLFPPPEGVAAEAASFAPDWGAGDTGSAYRFVLTGCEGSPVSKYHLVAIPVDADSEMKTFCIDQSGTLKSVAQGNESACFSRGQDVNPGENDQPTE